MSLYACDIGDGSSIYRERIALSDGTVECCESGITIPAGQPYALCQVAWSDENDLEELPDEEREKHFVDSSMPQCMEVWRLLRRNNFRHHACAAFGEAVYEYGEEMGMAIPCDRAIHARRYYELCRTIKRARVRYAEGRGPRLHASERASLESGEWADPLPFTRRIPREVQP